PRRPPARPVYAPALVAFVGGPRAGLSIAIGGGVGVAWFPLGPHEVYRPAYQVSEVYVRQVNISHVTVTNINVTNVRYVNQNASSVTVVSHDAFVGARPVRAAQVSVSAEAISQGRVIGATANIAPERVSVMGRPQGAVAAPPSRFAGRAVVVRHAPPPPPVSFAARRDALQANPRRTPFRRATTAQAGRSSRPQRARRPRRPIKPAASRACRSSRRHRARNGKLPYNPVASRAVKPTRRPRPSANRQKRATRRKRSASSKRRSGAGRCRAPRARHEITEPNAG